MKHIRNKVLNHRELTTVATIRRIGNIAASAKPQNGNRVFWNLCTAFVVFLLAATASGQEDVAPTIAQQSQDWTGFVLINQFVEVTFSVEAEGSPPLNYQWRFNGINIPGSTDASYTYSAYADSDLADDYSVVISNAYGAVTSRVARLELTVLVPLVITVQPQDAAIPIGDCFTLTVEAEGTGPLSYQWYKGHILWPGETRSSFGWCLFENNLFLLPADYSVVVTDSVGSVTSRVAHVEALLPPSLVQAPLNQSVVEGGTAVFSVEVEGTLPMSYRWRNSGITITNIIAESSQGFLYIPNVTTNNARFPYDVIIQNMAVTHPSQAVFVRGFTLTVLADEDHDGMPDSWEGEHLVDDPNDDPDRDGMTNKEEYEAGTDPNDPNSNLKIVNFEATGSAIFEFQAISNKTYTVEFADELGASNWFRLVDFSARTNSRFEPIHDPASTPQRYYRLVTPRQQ